MSDLTDDVSAPTLLEVARDAGLLLREIRGPKTFPNTEPDPEEES